MAKNDSSDNRELWSALERIAALASIAIVISLSYLYFQIPSWQILSEDARDFVMALIVNVIPVYILFVISYFLFRKIQILRASEDKQELAQYIATKIHAENKKPSVLYDNTLSLPEKTIKLREDITAANIGLINQAKQNVISFSGDLSWTKRCHEALLDAVRHNIAVRILCKDPLNDEAKRHVERYFQQPGIDIRYYPSDFDPDIRGLMTDTSTSRHSLFVEKKHKTLGDDYERTGAAGTSETYEYWGQRFDSEHDLAIVSPLSKLFDMLWEQAKPSNVLYTGDWHDVERELKRLPQYKNARMSIRMVKLANLKPLHRFIDEREYVRIQDLSKRFQRHNIPLWNVVTVHSSISKKTICPPIVEIHNNDWIVFDGLARVYHSRQDGSTDLVACVIENVNKPPSGAVWTWNQVQVVTQSDYTKDENFQDYNASFWRDYDGVHSSLERMVTS